MSAAPDERNTARALAGILREARRLNFEPHSAAATLFNGLLNDGWTEDEILSGIRFPEPPPLRLRHPQPDRGSTEPSLRHTGRITQLAFAADRSAVFSCSDAGEIIRWQLADGAPAYARHAHIGAITACIVLPDTAPEDKPRLLTAGADRCARLWKAESGELRAEMAGHDAAVICMAVRSGGDRALTGSADHTLRLWNLEHGTSMAICEGQAAAVTACTFAPPSSGVDRREMFSGGADGSIILWGDDGKALHRFSGHTARITSLTVVPGANVLVSTADDCTIRIWNLSSRQQSRVLAGHILGVGGCIVSGTTQATVISWSLDRTIRRWRLDSGEAIGPPLSHEAAVEGCADAGGGRLLSWSADGTLRLWNLASSAELTRVDEKAPFHAADCQSGQCAAATANGALRMWKTDGLILERTICSGDPAVALVRPPAGYTPDGFWTATNAMVVSAQITELDAATGQNEPLESSGLERMSGFVGGTVAADGRRALLWTRDMLACVELEDGPVSAEWAHEASVDGAVMTRDGARALVWSGNAINLWNVETGRIEGTLTGHSDRVSACLVIDDRQACSASFDGTLRVWDLSVLAETGRGKGHTGRVLGCISAGGGLLLSWSDDQTVRLWNLPPETAGTGLSEIGRFDVPGKISTVALGDGAYASPPDPQAGLLIGTADGRMITLRSGEEPHEVRLHTHRIRDIVFVAEAVCFASCSDDGSVRLWRDDEPVAGAVFFTGAPIVRLMVVDQAVLALDEQGRVSILDVTGARPTVVRPSRSGASA